MGKSSPKPVQSPGARNGIHDGPAVQSRAPLQPDARKKRPRRPDPHHCGSSALLEPGTSPSVATNHHRPVTDGFNSANRLRDQMGLAVPDRKLSSRKEPAQTLRDRKTWSRLERIQDWESLAKDAAYDPVTMAALCPISLRQLERFFRLHFGKSPGSWAMELRCRRARELLGQGYSNKGVVAELNFASESHFCHVFKKAYGCSPQTFTPLYGQVRRPEATRWLSNECSLLRE